MARTWLSLRVELLGGRGAELWPPPGRLLAIGPSHTFMDLAITINDAFGRWDRSHLSMFTLDDGRTVTDFETGAELAGTIGSTLELTTARVTRTVRPGAEFRFVYDLGDAWTHSCLVGDDRIDPLTLLGVRPRKPVAYQGWGEIPDQHGRRWADEDSQGAVATKPVLPHAMLLHAWPEQERVPTLDLTEMRGAIATGDASRFLAATTGRDLDDALQQVGSGVPMALDQHAGAAEALALTVINRLTWRAGAGDLVLAEDLLAHLRGDPPTRRLVPVDLDVLSAGLEGDVDMATVGYVDLLSGQIHAPGDTEVVDDTDRWLRFDSAGSRDGLRDMAAFAERHHDEGLRARLHEVIGETGAARRFRDLLHAEGLVEPWYVFSTDRQHGRARDFLADHGVRVS